MQEVAALAGETPTRKAPQILPLVAPFFNHKGGQKGGCCPIFNQEKRGQSTSNPAKNGQRATEDMKWKNPEKPQFFGVFEHF